MVFVQKRFVFALALAMALTASAAFAAANVASADKTEKKNAAAAAIEKITGTNKPATSKTEASKPANKTETAKPAGHESAKTASLDAMIAQKVKEKNGTSSVPSKPATSKTEVSKPEITQPAKKIEAVKPAAAATGKTASLDAMIAQKLKGKESGASTAAAGHVAAVSHDVHAAAAAKLAQVSADVKKNVESAVPTVPTTPAVPTVPSAITVPTVPASMTALAGRPLKPSEMKAGDPETAESLLVTAEWLKSHRNQVVIVDSRPESLYAGGHIPNAVNASWTYFANMTAPAGSMKYGTVYPASAMGRRLGALGIDGKKTVVAYCDAGGWGQSGWTVWILRMCGIKNAKILNGGMTAWKQAGGPVTKARAFPKKANFNVSAYKANYLVNTEWIDDNLGKQGLAIIDVRTEAEYAGKIRPFKEKRAGHLPTAINIGLESFVTPDYHYKSVQEIKDLLTANGITPETEIVVYDTAGVRAAYVTMVLRYAGYTKSQCYDEGFQAWAGKADLPLEK